MMMWKLLLFVGVCKGALLDLGDVEALLASTPSEAQMVAPQGLIIIQRTTTTTTSSSAEAQTIPAMLNALFQSPFFADGESNWVASRYDDDDDASFFYPGKNDFSLSFEGGEEDSCPCGTEVTTLCPVTVEPDDDFGAMATVYDKRLCLARAGDLVSQRCSAHLARAPTVVEYCATDIDQYCASVRPGQNRVHECLKRSLLSDTCSEYLNSFEENLSFFSEEEESYDLTAVLETMVQTSFDLFKKTLDTAFVSWQTADILEADESIDFLQDELYFKPVVQQEPCHHEDVLPMEQLEAPVLPMANKEAAPVAGEKKQVSSLIQNVVAPEEAQPKKEEEVPKEEEEEEKRSFLCYLRFMTLVVLALAMVCSLYTFVSYGCRLRQQRKEHQEFIVKFKPLLLEV